MVFYFCQSTMKFLDFAVIAISVVFLGLFDLVVTIALQPPHFTGTTTMTNTESDYIHRVHTDANGSPEVTRHSKVHHDCTSAPCATFTREVDARVVDEGNFVPFHGRAFTHTRHTTRTWFFGNIGSPVYTDTYWQPDATGGIHTSYVISQFVPEYTDPTWVPSPIPTSHLPLEDRSEMPPTGTHSGAHPEHTQSKMQSKFSYSYGTMDNEATHHGSPHRKPTHKRTTHLLTAPLNTWLYILLHEQMTAQKTFLKTAILNTTLGGPSALTLMITPWLDHVRRRILLNQEHQIQLEMAYMPEPMLSTHTTLTIPSGLIQHRSL